MLEFQGPTGPENILIKKVDITYDQRLSVLGDSNNLYSQYCIYQSKPSAKGVAAIKLDEAPFEA